MPIHNYTCDKCERTIEVITYTSEDAAKVPELTKCCGEQMRKDPCASRSYQIKGCNDASVTPSRFRQTQSH
jgi:predicted nucleic acid-binding Zn ribbon protein